MQIQGETSVNKLILLFVFDKMESALSRAHDRGNVHDGERLAELYGLHGIDPEASGRRVYLPHFFGRRAAVLDYGGRAGKPE